MTNPAVEALKRIDEGFYSHRMTIREAQKIARKAVAQAEQTPVAGRWVSLSDFLSIQSLLAHLADFHSWTGQHEESLDVKEFIAKLRAQPSETVRREGE